MTVTELKAKLAEKTAAKKAELATLMETIKITNELDKMESPIYNQRELSKTDNATLDAYKAIINEAYIADDRKMSVVFGYGVIPSKILAIMKSIQFSKQEEKFDFMTMSNLDEQLIEDTLTAFGNTAYFSKDTVEVIPEIPMDIPKVRSLLALAAKDMGLVGELDLSPFNDLNVDYQYTRSRVRAETQLENTKAYIEETVAYNE